MNAAQSQKTCLVLFASTGHGHAEKQGDTVSIYGKTDALSAERRQCFFVYQESSTFCTNLPSKQKTLREDATGCMRNMTAYGSLHLARKAEQVPQGLRDLGSDKRTCPLCSVEDK